MRGGILIDTFGWLIGRTDGPARRMLAATVGLVTFASILAALTPIALKELVDSFTTGAALAKATAFGSLYVLALAGSRILADLRPMMLGRLEQRLSASIRLKAFDHLLHLPLSFHLQHRVGATIQTIHQAIDGARMVLHWFVGALLPVVIELSCMALVLTQLDQPRLLAIVLIGATAYGALLLAGARSLTRRSAEVLEASLNGQAVLTEHLANCEALKCNTATRESCRRLADAAELELLRWDKLLLQRARMGASGSIVFSLTLGAALLHSAQAVIDGTLTVGGFVLVNAYILQIIRPIEVLGAGSRDLLQATTWIRPLRVLLDLQPEGAQASASSSRPGGPANPRSSSPWAGRPPLPAPAHPLIVENLSFGYEPGRRILQHISFTLSAGRTIGIVGPSGSGKSSLVRLILRLHEVDEGRITLGDVPLGRYAPDEVRRFVGTIPQEPCLFNDTLSRNIGLGASEASPEAIIVAAHRAGLGKLLASLPNGSESQVGERGLMLSGGERQRIGIARAILRSPRILLLDEATSMLDSATEACVMDSLRKALAGRSMLIVAHRLSSVAHADEILVLDRGLVAERGTHAELLRSDGYYARTWRLQHAQA